jgi:hypothetical protein
VQGAGQRRLARAGWKAMTRACVVGLGPVFHYGIGLQHGRMNGGVFHFSIGLIENKSNSNLNSVQT